MNLHPWLKAIESTLAEEASAHAEAVLAINSFSDAETLNLDPVRAVYAGNYSPVNGAHGLTSSDALENVDEIIDFFASKEAPARFWVPDFLRDEASRRLGRSYTPTVTQKIYGTPLENLILPSPPVASDVCEEGSDWALHFTRTQKNDAKEPSLFALVKLHQRHTRRHQWDGRAAYVYYGQVAWCPSLADETILAAQLAEAKNAKCPFFASLFPSSMFQFAYVYERTFYEPAT